MVAQRSKDRLMVSRGRMAGEERHPKRPPKVKAAVMKPNWAVVMSRQEGRNEGGEGRERVEGQMITL